MLDGTNVCVHVVVVWEELNYLDGLRKIHKFKKQHSERGESQTLEKYQHRLYF